MKKSNFQFTWGQFLLEWGLVSIAFAVIAWRSINVFGTADSYGYEMASWLITQGRPLYTELVHSQGPLYLYWGALWSLITGGWWWAFRLSSFLSFELVLALSWLIMARRGIGPAWRLPLLFALAINPITLFGAWQFLGLNELMLGLMVSLWGLWFFEKPNALLIAIGLAIALANRMMALPWCLLVFGWLILKDMRSFWKTLGLLTAVYLLILVLTAGFGGLDDWWMQSVKFHALKKVQMKDLLILRLKKAAYLLPLALPLFIAWKNIEERVRVLFILSIGLGLAGVLSQPVIGSYYFLPVLLLFWIASVEGLAGGGNKPGNLPSPLLITPIIALGLWLSITAALPLKRESSINGFAKACSDFKKHQATGETALVEASLAWKFFECKPFKTWNGWTDTNLMLFNTLYNYDQFLYSLTMNGPGVMVLYTNNGLAIMPGFLDTIRPYYKELPRGKNSFFVVLVRKKTKLDSPTWEGSVKK